MHAGWLQHFDAHRRESTKSQRATFRQSVIDAVVSSIESPGVSFSYFSKFAETPDAWLLTGVPAELLPRDDRAQPTSQDVPEAHDWRELGFTLPVRDQYLGQGISSKGCGSCWAWASVGAVSGAHWLSSKEVVELSVQQLVDCDRDEEIYPMRSNLGCGGGFTNTTFTDLERNQSLLVPAEAYPYVAQDQACAVPAGRGLPWSRVLSHTMVWPEDSMAAALVQYGPLAASLDAKSMKNYKGGVFDPLFFQCNGANLNHALLIIGYGVDGGKPYWRIQNSWGEDWGEEGFYRLRKGKRACGIDQRPIYVTLAGSAAAIV